MIHAFDPANYVEVGQPIDEAWAGCATTSSTSTSRITTRRPTATCPPGPATARFPGCSRRPSDSGYDGFCVLEPHLVVAEKSFGFTGPERFADAATALKQILREASIAFG